MSSSHRNVSREYNEMLRKRKNKEEDEAGRLKPVATGKPKRVKDGSKKAAKK